jgi:hypothetical protein
MTLVTTIGSIAERIHKNSYRNETDVREAIVNRVLYELGWTFMTPQRFGGSTPLTSDELTMRFSRRRARRLSSSR